METRICPRCKIAQPLKEFRMLRGKGLGLASECLVCREIIKEMRAKKKEEPWCINCGVIATKGIDICEHCGKKVDE